LDDTADQEAPASRSSCGIAMNKSRTSATVAVHAAVAVTVVGAPAVTVPVDTVKESIVLAAAGRTRTDMATVAAEAAAAVLATQFMFSSST
jgi:hypothetical protein